MKVWGEIELGDGSKMGLGTDYGASTAAEEELAKEYFTKCDAEFNLILTKYRSERSGTTEDT